MAVGQDQSTNLATRGAGRRYPLGLPAGSVRALLALLVVAVAVVQTGRGQPLPEVWSETVMIVLAHYFGTRRFLNLPGALIRRLEQEGYLEEEPQPLYLPRRSVRMLLIAAFVGLAIYLYGQQRLFSTEGMSLLGLVFAYFLGLLARAVLAWWTRRRGRPPAPWWADLQAGVVLVALGVTAAAYLLDRPHWLPRQWQNASLALVLFYFGSR